MTAEGQAAAMVAAVRDDPVRRLELAVGFYDRRTGAPGVRSDRRAELAFMRWVQFLRQPSPRAWYLAHNASIVAGYLAHRDLAEREQQLERFFMDVALIRVLYAHSLLTAPRLALRRLAPAAGCSAILVGAVPTWDRHAWTTVRARVAVALLTRLTRELTDSKRPASG